MDQEKAFKDALELASTFRYSEAQEKLLSLIAEKPDYVDALLLLGKVEYYLKLFSSSRKRFETVLTYEPANQAAYFGIEYYKERNKKFGFFISCLLGIILLAGAAVVLSFSLNSSFHQGLSSLEKSIYNKLEVLESSLQLHSGTQEKIDEKLILQTKELNELNELLIRYIDSSESCFEDTTGDLARLREKMEALSNDQVRLLRNYRELLKLFNQQIEDKSAETAY